MATALTVVPHSPAPVAVPAFTMSEIERVALAIAKGNLFGTNDANAVLTLCLLAQAEGQHPATVFRDYHVIKGKPAKKADAMLRDFINSGGKVEWHALDDKCADATFTHPAGKARIAWDMERARTAGLATDMWRKYPRQMLRSRVISEGIRTVYPGATSGLYVTEEVQDMTGDAVDLTPEPPAAAPEPKPKRERMEGPCSTVAELRERCRGIQSDIEGAEDAEALESVVDTNLDVFAQLRRYKPDWWDNGDYGLSPLIERQRAYFANAGEEGTALDPADPQVDAVALEFPDTSESFRMMVAELRACATDAAVTAYVKRYATPDVLDAFTDLERDLLKDVATAHRAAIKQRGFTTAG